MTDDPRLTGIRAQLEHRAAFCRQVARDGILPSLAWFTETADKLDDAAVAVEASPRAAETDEKEVEHD
jgi:hypothetical protein